MNQTGLFGWGAPFKEGWETIALSNITGPNAPPLTLKVTAVCKKK